MSVAKTVNTRKRAIIRSILVWGGTASLLTYLGLTTNLPETWRALTLANPLYLAIVAIGFVAITFSTDVSSVRFLLKRGGFDVHTADLFRIKGASYLLNILNYNLALAMMAATLSRHTDKGLGTTGSPFIYLNFIDLAIMSIQVLVGVWFAELPFPDAAVTVLLLISACGLLSPFALWGIVRVRHLPPFMSKILGHAIFSSCRDLSFAELLRLFGLRALLIIEYLFMTYCFLRVFGIKVPLDALLVYSPILALVAFIPISIAGLGSTQVVMRIFYAPFAPIGIDPIASVDAYSTVSLLVILSVRIGISLVCLPAVSRMMGKSQQE